MGYAYVDMSKDLLTGMLTEGWYSERAECIEGLPEGAQLLKVYTTVRGIIRLIFEHPSFICDSWAELDDMENIEVTLRRVGE